MIDARPETQPVWQIAPGRTGPADPERRYDEAPQRRFTRFQARGICYITNISDTHWVSFRLILVTAAFHWKPRELPTWRGQRPNRSQTSQPGSRVTDPNGLSFQLFYCADLDESSAFIVGRVPAGGVGPDCL
jgi:hypothetical protein